MNLSKTFAAVQYASRKLLALNDEKINQILLAVADAAEERTDFYPCRKPERLEPHGYFQSEVRPPDAHTRASERNRNRYP